MPSSDCTETPIRRSFRLKRVLFPVDFSERALGAARYVQNVARTSDAAVTLLHVVEPGLYGTRVNKLAVRTSELRGFAAAEFRGLPVSRLVLEGEPAPHIVETARLRDIDLIMMPTHGWGLYREMILGSVTGKVLRDADCPVWTCEQAEHAPSREEIRCKRILCAVDLASQSAEIIDWTCSFAALYQADITIVHVCEDGETGSANLGDAGIHHWQEEKARIALENLCRNVAQPFDMQILSGEVAREVHAATRKCGADLIIIGRNSVAGLVGHFRSTGYSLIRHSPCPVISI
jgi:nucleotide-binding universal stress UspA family protein